MSNRWHLAALDVLISVLMCMLLALISSPWWIYISVLVYAWGQRLIQAQQTKLNNASIT